MMFAPETVLRGVFNDEIHVEINCCAVAGRLPGSGDVCSNNASNAAF